MTKLFQSIHQQNVSTNDFEVLIAIKAGHNTANSIASFCGLSRSATQYRLKPLMEQSLIIRSIDFHYELTIFGEGTLTQIFNFLNA